MDRDVARFIDDYFAELDAGNAAIFAGAGLSVPAGFVDWRELMRHDLAAQIAAAWAERNWASLRDLESARMAKIFIRG